MGFHLRPIVGRLFAVLHYCIDKAINGCFFYPLCTWRFNTYYYSCSETYQAVIKMEPLQESLFVKHINGWLINILQQTPLYCTIIHRLIAMDKRVLHNAACYSFQEQSGAPPHVSLPNLRVSS